MSGGATGSVLNGGATGPGAFAGAGTLPATGGATATDATGGIDGTAGVVPEGGVSVLAGLYAAPVVPVHPHLDDPTGGWLDAYAAVDHTHPSTVSGEWVWGTAARTTDPGNGRATSNTGLLATATVLAVSNTTNNGLQAPGVEYAMGPGDQVYVQDQNDNTRWARYDVAAVAAKFPTYSTVPVALAAFSGTEIANDQVIQIAFHLQGGGGGGAADFATLRIQSGPPPAPPADFWFDPTEAA